MISVYARYPNDMKENAIGMPEKRSKCKQRTPFGMQTKDKNMACGYKQTQTEKGLVNMFGSKETFSFRAKVI